MRKRRIKRMPESEDSKNSIILFLKLIGYIGIGIALIPQFFYTGHGHLPKTWMLIGIISSITSFSILFIITLKNIFKGKPKKCKRKISIVLITFVYILFILFVVIYIIDLL